MVGRRADGWWWVRVSLVRRVAWWWIAWCLHRVGRRRRSMAVVRRGREMPTHVRRSVVRNGSIRRMRWVRHRVAVTGMSWMLIIRTVVRVRWRCVHRTRRCPRAWVRVAIARTCVHLRLVMSVSVARRAHGPASDSRNGTLFLNGRFRVHALFWADVAKLRVVGRLHKML